MNLTILPVAATEDVKQIEAIVKSIDESMTTLNEVFTVHIPEGVDTEWSRELLSNWERCYQGSVQNVMEGMLLSAHNLQLTIDAAEQYNK